MPFHYLVFFRFSACGYGTVKRQKRGNKEKNATQKSKRRNNAWRKDEKVNCAARTHVNHENKQAPKRLKKCYAK